MNDTNMNILHEVAAAVAMAKGPWLIGGDWKLTPEVLQKSGYAEINSEADRANTPICEVVRLLS